MPQKLNEVNSLIPLKSINKVSNPCPSLGSLYDLFASLPCGFAYPVLKRKSIISSP